MFNTFPYRPCITRTWSPNKKHNFLHTRKRSFPAREKLFVVCLWRWIGTSRSLVALITGYNKYQFNFNSLDACTHCSARHIIIHHACTHCSARNIIIHRQLLLLLSPDGRIKWTRLLFCRFISSVFLIKITYFMFR